MCVITLPYKSPRVYLNLWEIPFTHSLLLMPFRSPSACGNFHELHTLFVTHAIHITTCMYAGISMTFTHSLLLMPLRSPSACGNLHDLHSHPSCLEDLWLMPFTSPPVCMWEFLWPSLTPLLFRGFVTYTIHITTCLYVGIFMTFTQISTVWRIYSTI